MISADFRQGSNERQLGHVGSHRVAFAVMMLFVLVLALELMPVSLEDGVLHGPLLVVGQQIRVDHVVEGQFGDVVQIAGGHVQADRAVEDHGSQLE